MLTVKEAIVAAFEANADRPMQRKDIIAAVLANSDSPGTEGSIKVVIEGQAKRPDGVIVKLGSGQYALNVRLFSKGEQADRMKRIAAASTASQKEDEIERLRRAAADQKTPEDRLRDENSDLASDLKQARKIIKSFEEGSRVADRLVDAVREAVAEKDFSRRTIPAFVPRQSK